MDILFLCRRRLGPRSPDRIPEQGGDNFSNRSRCSGKVFGIPENFFRKRDEPDVGRFQNREKGPQDEGLETQIRFQEG